MAKNSLLREKAENFFEILFSLKGPFWGQKESSLLLELVTVAVIPSFKYAV